MASRRHRPIVMNRHKKPSGRSGIVRRVWSIIVVFGLTGMAIAYYANKVNKETKTAVTPTEGKPVAAKKEVVKDTLKILSESISPIAVQEQQQMADTSGAIKPLAALKKAATNGTPVDTRPSKNEPPANKTAETKLTPERMNGILNDIRLERQKSNNTANCIQVRITNTSNVENGFEVVNFLKSNGYIISGREVIRSAVEGVEIDATGTCIKLTIGSL